MAAQNNITSIAFPLIATGGFGYPKEEEYFGSKEFEGSVISSGLEIELMRREEAKLAIGRRLFREKEKSETIQKEKEAEDFDYDSHESALDERMKHISDTFSEYLLYLIDSKGMSYPDVYKRAIVDKKVFSRLKNNPDSHPKKITAMCLCIGARLNLDQTRDLLARAGMLNFIAKSRGRLSNDLYFFPLLYNKFRDKKLIKA